MGKRKSVLNIWNSTSNVVEAEKDFAVFHGNSVLLETKVLTGRCGNMPKNTIRTQIPKLLLELLKEFGFYFKENGTSSGGFNERNGIS